MRTSFYYDKALMQELLPPGYDPMNPDHVELLPGNIFWTAIPDNHELTFDINGIPNGSALRPEPVDSLVRADLLSANITQGRITVELFKESQALANDLATIYADIQSIAITHGVTDEVVFDAVG